MKSRRADGPRVDSALVKAFAETEADEPDDEDEDEEDGQFVGAKVVARLRDALSALGTRVIDVFKQWDANSDGVVSREEFHMAMPLLGLKATYPEIEQLFNLFDPDRSGTIDYRELDAQLRTRGQESGAPKFGPVALRMRNTIATRKLAPLAPGAGLIDQIAATLHKDRKKDPFLNKLSDDGSSKDAIAAVRGLLSQHNSRVIELFRQWDKDNSGTVSKSEFRNAVKFLGLKCSPRRGRRPV